MKHSIITLMLMVSLCLYTKSSYAYPFQALIEPRCSECNGHGFTQNFWGQRIRCENCGGDGKTFRWWLAVVLGVMWWSIFCKNSKK